MLSASSLSKPSFSATMQLQAIMMGALFILTTLLLRASSSRTSLKLYPVPLEAEDGSALEVGAKGSSNKSSSLPRFLFLSETYIRSA
jgi:hypothetical protein